VSDRPQDVAVGIRRLFDRDAASYYEAKYGGTDPRQQYSFAARLALVVEMLGPHPGDVLDVGCGPGVMIEAVVARGGRLTGIDLSAEMVGRARDRSRALRAEDRCRFVVGSAEGLPFEDAAFDAVTAMGVLEYVPDDARALREMARVVRPGGVVIVTVPNLVSPWRLLPVLAKPPCLRFLKPAYRAARGRVAPAEGCELDRFPRRLYTSWVLGARLADAGLRKVDGVFYNFRLPILGTVCPRGAVRVAAALAPLGRSGVAGWIGGGYIAKARREPAPSPGRR